MPTHKYLDSAIPIDTIDPSLLEEIVTKSKDYALMHGICMRSRTSYNPDTLQVSFQHSKRNRYLFLFSRSLDFFSDVSWWRHRIYLHKKCLIIVTKAYWTVFTIRLWLFTNYYHYFLVRTICVDTVAVSSFRIRKSSEPTNNSKWAYPQCCARWWVPSWNIIQHH